MAQCRQWGVEGRGFADAQNYFDRLPGRAHGVVREEVWNLSRHTTGMSAHFETDASAIHIRYQLTQQNLALPNMPASGVSGFDLYAKVENVWRWLATHQPTAPSQNAIFIENLQPHQRAYHVNFPLHNGVRSFEIGIQKGTNFTPIAPRKTKPILFYGTSITHGLCASRPGMTFVNILGRRLDRPILNFGFSGNGRMEIEVGQYLAELDPEIFVIDCVANMSPQWIAERTAPLVKLLRTAHPLMPIVLLAQRKEPQMILVPTLKHDRRRRMRRSPRPTNFCSIRA